MEDKDPRRTYVLMSRAIGFICELATHSASGTENGGTEYRPALRTFQAWARGILIGR